MKLDKTSSEILNIMRFPLIIGVVFIHAYGSNVNLQDETTGITEIGFLSKFTQDIISDGIARVAVPLFFIISGYLFFLDFNNSMKKYKSKVKGRIKTLVIPFLFWNVATMSVLLIAQTIPSTSIFFSGSKQLITTYSFFDFLNSLLGLDKSPISYQFWFIRDLILMVCIAPLIALILSYKKISVMFLFGLFVLWFLNLWPIYIPSIAAFFFFYVGAYLGHNKKKLLMDNYVKKYIVFYPMLLLIDGLTKEQIFNSYIHNLGILLGIATALYLSKLAYKNKRFKARLVKLSSYSFFVFAIHEPTLTILKKVVYKIVTPSSDLTITAIYMALPVIIILISLILHIALNKLMPKTLNIICGSR